MHVAEHLTPSFPLTTTTTSINIHNDGGNHLANTTTTISTTPTTTTPPLAPMEAATTRDDDNDDDDSDLQDCGQCAGRWQQEQCGRSEHGRRGAASGAGGREPGAGSESWCIPSIKHHHHHRMKSTTAATPPSLCHVTTSTTNGPRPRPPPSCHVTIARRCRRPRSLLLRHRMAPPLFPLPSATYFSYLDTYITVQQS